MANALRHVVRQGIGNSGHCAFGLCRVITPSPMPASASMIWPRRNCDQRLPHYSVPTSHRARTLSTTSCRAQPSGEARATGAPVLLFCEWINKQLWYDQLRAAGLPVAWPDEIRDWAQIRFAVGWNITPEVLAKMPQLRAIASMGAGVDHTMRPGLIPPGVEVLRIVDPLMAQRMATWVMWAVIHHQRKMDEYAQAQAERRWDKSIERLKPWDNADVRVGIMGYGAMGSAAGDLLHAAGYSVSAWARSPRAGADTPVRLFAGREQLRSFVQGCDVLVCLLPLTPETQGIISTELLSWLPRGGAVINAARGKHLDEAALLDALDAGHVSRAILDVFQIEPLPTESRLWSHPRVRITPHVSSITDVPNAVAQIADNYRRMGEGRPFVNVANQAAGY